MTEEHTEKTDAYSLAEETSIAGVVYIGWGGCLDLLDVCKIIETFVEDIESTDRILSFIANNWSNGNDEVRFLSLLKSLWQHEDLMPSDGPLPVLIIDSNLNLETITNLWQPIVERYEGGLSFQFHIYQEL